MSSINKTPHYNLSQFGDSPDDKPSWRGDYTGDMSKIDSQMYRNATDATTATSIANTAKTTADSALSLAQSNKADIAGDEEAVKALLGDNTVDAATIAKIKWDKAGTDAANIMQMLAALGADTVETATGAKAKWDEAADDVTALAPQVAGNTGALAALHAETAQKAALLYQQIVQGAALGKVTDAGIRVGRVTAGGVWDGYSLLVRRHGGVDVLNDSGTPVVRLDETGIQYYDTLFNGFTYAASNTTIVNTKNDLPATGIEKQKTFVTQENRVYVWHDGKWRIDGGYVVKHLTWIDTAQTPHSYLYIDVFYNPESGYVTIVTGYDVPIKGLSGGFVGNLGNLPLPLCPVSDDLRSSSVWLAQETDYEVSMVLATGAITFRTANVSTANDSHYVRGIITYPCRAGAWATDEQLGVDGDLASVTA